MKQTARLYAAMLAWAFWIGGFSFYFGVVVPVGTQVIGSSEQGFVTQQVTHWLNLSSIVVLLILFGSALLERCRVLLATWGIMVLLQGALFVLHGRLNDLLDSKSKTVINRERFSTLHETYEFVATLLWLAGMIHLWFLVRRVARPKG